MPTLRFSVTGLKKENAHLFEEAALGVSGVTSVDTWSGRAEVHMSTAAAEKALRSALTAAGFKVRKGRPSAKEHADDHCGQCEILPVRRPSIARLAALFGFIIIAGSLFRKLGLDSSYQIGGSAHFFSALVIGLMAGSSACMGISGGLMLSTLPRLAHGSAPTLLARLRPSLLFIGGRTVSYAVLGGLIGLLGTALTPSPVVAAAITLFAAAVMLVMGLDMLNLVPHSLLRLIPRMPERFSSVLMNADGRTPFMPIVLGAATFFVPCGFTQTFQIYALTTGSFWAGAAVLGGFALGTAPALLALGWASSSLKGNTGRLFFHFSGALVIVLGLLNIQNGMTIVGHPLTLPAWPGDVVEVASAADPNVTLVDNVQVIKMKISSQEPFYTPSDRYTVKAGVPVRMEIEGQGGGCRSVFQIPKFDVRLSLIDPVNIVQFTPDQTGEATFSCSMGMFRGTLKVEG